MQQLTNSSVLQLLPITIIVHVTLVDTLGNRTDDPAIIVHIRYRIGPADRRWQIARHRLENVRLHGDGRRADEDNRERENVHAPIEDIIDSTRVNEVELVEIVEKVLDNHRL